MYLNKQHADKDYYQNVKRPQQANQNFIEQKLRKNDNILAKYYNYYEGEIVICNLDPLIIDGFDAHYLIGKTIIKGKAFLLSYNFIIRVFTVDGIQQIEIKKND